MPSRFDIALNLDLLTSAPGEKPEKDVDIFPYPELVEALRESLTKEFSVENLHFLEKLRNLSNQENVSFQDWQEVYDTFIPEGAKERVNIPDGVLKAITAAIEEGQAVLAAQGKIDESSMQKMQDAFLKAAIEIGALIKRDAWPRAKATDACQALLPSIIEAIEREKKQLLEAQQLAERHLQELILQMPEKREKMEEAVKAVWQGREAKVLPEELKKLQAVADKTAEEVAKAQQQVKAAELGVVKEVVAARFRAKQKVEKMEGAAKAVWQASEAKVSPDELKKLQVVTDEAAKEAAKAQEQLKEIELKEKKALEAKVAFYIALEDFQTDKDMLKDVALTELFRQHIDKVEHSLENLQFIEAINELGKKEQPTLEEWKKIGVQYVGIKAESQVNLGSAFETDITNALKEGTLETIRDAFVAAGKEVAKLQKKDSIKRFTMTDEYTNHFINIAENKVQESRRELQRLRGAVNKNELEIKKAELNVAQKLREVSILKKNKAEAKLVKTMGNRIASQKSFEGAMSNAEITEGKTKDQIEEEAGKLITTRDSLKKSEEREHAAKLSAEQASLALVEIEREVKNAEQRLRELEIKQLREAQRLATVHLQKVNALYPPEKLEKMRLKAEEADKAFSAASEKKTSAEELRKVQAVADKAAEEVANAQQQVKAAELGVVKEVVAVRLQAKQKLAKMEETAQAIRSGLIGVSAGDLKKIQEIAEEAAIAQQQVKEVELRVVKKALQLQENVAPEEELPSLPLVPLFFDKASSINLKDLDGNDSEVVKLNLDEDTQKNLEKQFRTFAKEIEQSDENVAFIDAVNKALALSGTDAMQIKEWENINKHFILPSAGSVGVGAASLINLSGPNGEAVKEALEKEPVTLEAIQDAFKSAKQEIVDLVKKDPLNRFKRYKHDESSAVKLIDYKTVISQLPEVREKLEQRKLKAQALAEEQAREQQIKDELKKAELKEALAAQAQAKDDLKKAKNELNVLEKELEETTGLDPVGAVEKRTNKLHEVEEKTSKLLIAGAKVEVEKQKLAVGVATENMLKAKRGVEKQPHSHALGLELKKCTVESEEAKKALLRAEESLKKKEEALKNIHLIRQAKAMETYTQAIREREQANSKVAETTSALKVAEGAVTTTKRYLTLFRKDDKNKKEDLKNKGEEAERANTAYQAALQAESKAKQNLDKMTSQVVESESLKKETLREPPSFLRPATPTRALANAAQAAQAAKRESVSAPDAVPEPNKPKTTLGNK